MGGPVYDLEEALEKVAAYCTYQERSQRQVREKLTSMGLHAEAVDELTVRLIQEGFLSEERFARAYARGKFRMKGWGRHKIRRGLRYHQIGDYLQKKALQEIDPAEYEATLQRLLQKYQAKRNASALAQRKARNRAFQAALRRGFEADLIQAAWESLSEERS
jgi:regulatory protein